MSSVLCLGFQAWAEATADSCVTCHSQLPDARLRDPVDHMADDVHADRRLSCANCHGGDPSDPSAAAMDPAKGFVGVPARNDIPASCATCHANPEFMRRFNPNLPTDQLAKYHISQHGKLNAQGNQQVAICTSCHGAHGIRAVEDSRSPVFATNVPGTCARCHANPGYMQSYGIPTDQYEQYAKSVHGEALLVKGDRGAPACNDCHGSHEASRPGAIAIGNVCAQCHALSRDLFVQSPHKAVHEALGLPECEVCHGDHNVQRTSDTMLGTGPDALCIRCHEAGSAGFTAASAMRESIDTLRERIEQAQTLVGQAERVGMEASDAAFDLDEAKGRLTRARAYIHSFSPPKVAEIATEGVGLADRARVLAQKALEELRFRRRGFVASLAIMAVLVVLLVLKIRAIERRR